MNGFHSPLEPKPPGYHSKLAGFHWLRAVDFDGRPDGHYVLQWNPGTERWSQMGDVATGRYVDTAGWVYIGTCEIPDVKPTRPPIMAWAWRCDGMKGWALGHLKPTPETIKDFHKKGYQVKALIAEQEEDVVESQVPPEGTLLAGEYFYSEYPIKGKPVLLRACFPFNVKLLYADFEEICRYLTEDEKIYKPTFLQYLLNCGWVEEVRVRDLQLLKEIRL